MSTKTATQRWQFTIPGYRPTSLNELLGSVRGRIRMKKAERVVICSFFGSSGIPKATGKRRVSLVIHVPKGQRRWDEDNLHKSIADALKHAGAIKDDSPAWIEWGPIDYVRPAALATTIILEDMT